MNFLLENVKRNYLYVVPEDSVIASVGNKAIKIGAQPEFWPRC